MADTTVLEAVAARRPGSSPGPSTKRAAAGGWGRLAADAGAGGGMEGTARGDNMALRSGAGRGDSRRFPSMFSGSATVIDCGASRTVLGVVGRGPKGTLRLREFAVVEFAAEPGRDDAWLGRTREALGGLRQRTKAVGPVTLVLPAHLVLTKGLRVPDVAVPKREKIIRFEAQQNIPYALTEVVWGHAVAGGGAELVGLLCAAKLEAVHELCGAAEAAGFALGGLVPAPVALGAGACVEWGAVADPVLVVSIGARSTTLGLHEAGRFHARSLPFGGQSVTLALMQSLDGEFKEAEALKVAGREAAAAGLAAEAFATRLAQEITRTVSHFKRQTGARPPVRVVVCGGGARLAGLTERLARQVQLPVAAANPLAAVEVSRAAASAGAGAWAGSLAELVGAGALRLRARGEVMNLLPARWRRQLERRRRRPWLVVAAGLAVAAVGPAWWHERAVVLALEARAAAVAAESAPLRARVEADRARLAALEAVRGEIARLEGTAARRTAWRELLADLQERLGKVEDAWLERLHWEAGAASGAAGGAGGGRRLAVSGRILDRTNPLAHVSPDLYRRVTALLASVAESPFIAAVEGERFDNRQPGILRFDFVIVPKPGGPL